MDKMKFKKIGNIVLNVLMYIFLAFCIFTVIVTLLSKRDSDGAAEIFGYQMRIVTSDSMAKSEYTDVSDYKIKVPEGLRLGRVDAGQNYSKPGINPMKSNKGQNRQRFNQKNFRKK